MLHDLFSEQCICEESRATRMQLSPRQSNLRGMKYLKNREGGVSKAKLRHLSGARLSGVALMSLRWSAAGGARRRAPLFLRVLPGTSLTSPSKDASRGTRVGRGAGRTCPLRRPRLWWPGAWPAHPASRTLRPGREPLLLAGGAGTWGSVCWLLSPQACAKELVCPVSAGVQSHD